MILGLPTELFAALILAVMIIVVSGYYALVRSVPAECMYMWKNNESKTFKVREEMSAPLIYLLRGRTVILTLIKKAPPRVDHKGGRKTRRLFLAFEGYPETIGPEQITGTTEAIEANAEGNLLQSATTGFAHAIETMNAVSQGFNRQTLMYCLLSGGCGMGITMLVLMLFGRI